jgi:hypothetical protein
MTERFLGLALQLSRLTGTDGYTPHQYYVVSQDEQLGELLEYSAMVTYFPRMRIFTVIQTLPDDAGGVMFNVNISGRVVAMHDHLGHRGSSEPTVFDPENPFDVVNIGCEEMEAYVKAYVEDVVKMIEHSRKDGRNGHDALPPNRGWNR